MAEDSVNQGDKEPPLQPTESTGLKVTQHPWQSWSWNPELQFHFKNSSYLVMLPWARTREGF